MYTTHGLMTGGDYAEYLKDTDRGTTEIQLDNVPDWFVELEILDTKCPVCGRYVEEHDSVTVTDAGGTIFACSIDGESHHADEL